jgi:hypothetical protein
MTTSPRRSPRETERTATVLVPNLLVPNIVRLRRQKPPCLLEPSPVGPATKPVGRYR